MAVPKFGSPPEQVTRPVEASSVLHQRLDMVVQLVQQARTEGAANHDLLIGEVRLLAGRVGSLEERASRNSDRVRDTNENDMRQDAELAQERDARMLLAKQVADIKAETTAQTAMLTKAAGFLRDPKVIFVGMVLYGIAKGWASKHGVELP